MPRLGWDMKVGSVAEWLKHDGDRVEVGEAICTIAGDKATTELEALDEGILRIPPQSPEPGEEVPVGTLLAYLLAPGEDVAAEKPPFPPGAHRRPPLPLGEGGGEDNASAHTKPSPALRAVSSTPRGTGLIAPDDGSRRIVASPRARRAAAALGVDWRALVGTGRGGRVLERDVQHASEQAEPVEAAVRMQGVRRLTAERMALSARTVAPVTLTTEPSTHPAASSSLSCATPDTNPSRQLPVSPGA